MDTSSALIPLDFQLVIPERQVPEWMVLVENCITRCRSVVLSINYCCDIHERHIKSQDFKVPASSLGSYIGIADGAMAALELVHSTVTPMIENSHLSAEYWDCWWTIHEAKSRVQSLIELCAQ